MAGCSCPVFATAFFMFICGGGLVAVLVLFWDDLVRGSTLEINWFRSSCNSSSSSKNVDYKVEEVFSGWLLVGTVLAAAVSVVTGFWGIVSSCRRSQCGILAYLALCVATAIINVVVIVVVSVILAAHCHQSVSKCMDSKERDYYIALWSILGGTFAILLMALFASWASCKEKCYCCGAEDSRYNVSRRKRNNQFPLTNTNLSYYDNQTYRL